MDVIVESRCLLSAALTSWNRKNTYELISSKLDFPYQEFRRKFCRDQVRKQFLF